MKRILYIAYLLLALSLCGRAQETTDAIRIACVGNSITYGAGIDNRDRDSYPAVLGQMLGRKYDVRNYGFSARTMLMKGDLPYMKEQMFRDVQTFNPNIVVMKLGTNDSKPYNWVHKKDFARDMQTMINTFRDLPAKPTIYLCYPAKAYLSQYGINDSVITNGIIPIIDRLAAQNKLEIIDLHTATSGMQEHFPDNIHPDPVGAHRIAETVYKAITGKEATREMQAFPGFKSEWNGYDRYDFTFNDRQAIVVAPRKARKGNPWIWRPAFFDAFPNVDKALLEKGFHVVYYDVTHLYGSPHAVALGTDFYNYMRRYYQLSPKVTLEGFSRGGLFAFNWAAKNTDKVACIYVDAPVCNLFSWPGRKEAQLWNDMLKEWGKTEEEMANFKENPIDNLAPLAAAGIPIISVCGDSDRTVPFKENMDVVRSRYLALGGPVEVIIKKGGDHHPHSLENPEPVVDFILRQQPEYKEYQHANLRGDLQNSFIKFEKERRGRVAFLGGSITEMDGWRNLVEQQLQQRFPYTEFEWVEAGIGSTGTTPGAFRLQSDVLSKGKIDLLFVEAAVNDHTNGFTASEQVRGMEGEVRHALLSNPDMDIVMLHFIYDPFIPMLAKQQIPDVILNHERVANHYLLPSINLAQEIGKRMQDGEFTWEEFGGTHPLPFGHKFYAAAIARLFDTMWANIPPAATIRPHEIPAQPLDKFSYYNGDFIDIREARLNKGWKLITNWHPDNQAGKRNGFVDVPMLEATRPGDRLKLNFKGKAIGIFCVAGPSAGILEYSVDGAPYKELDMFTEWSSGLYIPWVYMLETELEEGDHTLVLRISSHKNERSKGTECQIRNFVVNK
ncbi:alpha/beta fold hydrolase [Parabacteroides sp. AM08-6]|uniref:SGNH/GDSL hydrolase family protein n=1 Tax=Parabacteroides sp. AM08-6 TaxID=2292053 RepID=UPI000EFF0DB6|nr:alpha/beta fold hydrolase [Parabacteroides sp. AM08-6]RHJ79711.1 SGNH/GDSL hydrolase family protein [Parabacteroides sp. AM08-6]